MNIAIRKADKKDFNEIVRIFMEEYKEYPYYEKWSKERAVKKVETYFVAGRKIYIADASKDVAGFVIIETFIWDTEDRGIIDELVVSSKYQERGVGKKLIEEAERYFRKKGIEAIILSVNKKAKALKFYHKLNYKDSGYIELVKKLK